jgi:hypothetical protein
MGASVLQRSCASTHHAAHQSTQLDVLQPMRAFIRGPSPVGTLQNLNKTFLAGLGGVCDYPFVGWLMKETK